MDEELKELKVVLRSLVVSSPVQIDVRTLLRDFKEMMGCPLPIHKFGHRDPVSFFKECCSDSFILQGTPQNPILILIVPESTKHIDRFVQKQNSKSTKYKGKRRSVMSATNPAIKSQSNLIVETFSKRLQESKPCNPIERSRGNMQNVNNKITLQESISKSTDASTYTQMKHTELKQNDEGKRHVRNSVRCPSSHESNMVDKTSHHSQYRRHNSVSSSSEQDSNIDTLSSTSSKRMQLEKLIEEVAAIVLENPNSVWATDLLKLYRQRYGCELNMERFGYTSIVSLVQKVPGVSAAQVRGGDWRVWPANVDMPLPRASPPPVIRPRTPTPDPDDALPGVQFDPDVFPSDCLHYTESIPSADFVDIQAGDMLEVNVGEVYSPSHFWLLRLGEQNCAMDKIMDDMNQFYYGDGEGERRLAMGAVRKGHYCSSRYERDWHRSIIVKVIDSDTVKVRHVDYGTVERVQAQSLRPLRREWAALPAQAVRARLSGIRPPNGARRWPHTAATAFLSLVAHKPLIALVDAVDTENGILEVALVDTLTDEDVYISNELVHAGHAEQCLTTTSPEPYLSPTFDALENGDTLNYAEISAYLRDGVVLDFIEEYRRHVASALPSPPPSPPQQNVDLPVEKCIKAADEQETAKQYWKEAEDRWQNSQAILPEETNWQDNVAQLPTNPYEEYIKLPMQVCNTFRQLCTINPSGALYYIKTAIDQASEVSHVRPPPGFGPHRFYP